MRHGRTGRRGRKTLPRRRINGKAGAHRRTAKVRIDPPCRLRVTVRLQVGARATVQPASGGLNPCPPQPCSARTPWDAKPASKTKQRFVARAPTGKPKASPRPAGQPAARSTAGTTASAAIKFQRVSRAASDPVRPGRVSADPVLEGSAVATPGDPKLASGDRPQGVFGGCFEGVLRGWLPSRKAGPGRECESVRCEVSRSSSNDLFAPALKLTSRWKPPRSSGSCVVGQDSGRRCRLPGAMLRNAFGRA